MPADQDASKGYDPTAEEYYHGYGCTIVSTGQKIPIAAEFTESKQALDETAMRVTCDALAVEKPIWMTGDSAIRHARLARPPAVFVGKGSCQSIRDNARNTDDPNHIGTGSKPASTTDSEDVLFGGVFAIDARRRRTTAVVSRTNQRRRQDCGLGHVRARGRVHARAQVFLALCRIVIAQFDNDERGDNPGSTVITL